MTAVSEAKGAILSAVDAYGEAVEAAAVAPVQAELDAAVRLTIEQAETITDLRRQLAEAQASDYLGMWVGADVNVPNGNTLANFQTADRLIGPLRVRRSFPSPSSIAATVAADKAAGLISFTSLKPPLTDAQLTTIAKSISGYFTVLHEPEDNMSGPEFVALAKRTYEVAKAANPDLLVGPVNMGYWWLPGKLPGGPAAWAVPDSHCDFRGVDTYTADPAPLETDKEFRGWFDNQPDTKPLLIVEYGAYVVPSGGIADPAKQARRAEVIAQDHAWIKAQGRFDMWCYWYATGEKGNWAFTDEASVAAWREVSAAGRAA